LHRHVGPGAAGDDQGLRAAALEIAGWAAYYQRDFPKARTFVENALAHPTQDPSVRAGALALGGRIDHGEGTLDAARSNLEESLRMADEGPEARERVAGIWLAWLRADQGEADQALRIVGAESPSVSAHPFVVAHRLIVLSYAAGLRGRIDESLAHLAQLDAEVCRRHLTRFAGRSLNYRAWLYSSGGHPAGVYEDLPTQRFRAWAAQLGLGISCQAGTFLATQALKELGEPGHPQPPSHQICRRSEAGVNLHGVDLDLDESGESSRPLKSID